MTTYIPREFLGGVKTFFEKLSVTNAAYLKLTRCSTKHIVRFALARDALYVCCPWRMLLTC